MIAAATATDPYSSIIIQSGTTHGRCGKKADEHCQPSHNLWSRHSLERCKNGIIKAEPLHVGAERADRNPALVEKWYVQKSEDDCN